MPFSSRLSKLEPFEVMEILSRAKEMERRGEEVIHLEIGEPDFPTPEPVVEEAVKALRGGDTHYTEAQGIPELREEIAEKYYELLKVEVSPNEVTITGGVSQGLNFILAAIIERRSEAVITDPAYPCYSGMIKFYGGKVKKVALLEEKNYSLDIEELQKSVSKDTSLILLNSPSNPTGTYLSKRELKQVVEIAEDYNAYVLCDEIYSGLVYDRQRTPSLLETGYEKAVVLDGFSKLYAMTGWRLGYIVTEKKLTSQVVKLQQNFYISASSFAQRAAIVALNLREEVEAMKREFDMRRELILSKLEKLRGFKTNYPRAAYYVFPGYSYDMSSRALAEYLLEKARVALTPGRGFGERGEYHLRFSYANSRENIEIAMERIKDAIEEL